MTTNEMLSKLHLAIVQKVAVSCAADGSAKRAIEIGNDIIAYGKAWTEGFADDGRLDDAEIGKVQDAFEGLTKKYIPDFADPAFTDLLWNGLGGFSGWCVKKLFGLEFRGLPYLIEKHLGLVV